MFSVASGIAREEATPEHTAHIAAFEQGQVKRELRDSGWKADDEEAAFPGDAAQRRLAIVAADGIEDDVRAGRPNRLLKQARERLLAIAVERPRRINDRLVRARPARHCRLLV